jgi:hypothetical protein
MESKFEFMISYSDIILNQYLPQKLKLTGNDGLDHLNYKENFTYALMFRRFCNHTFKD